jgi:hypothetical protein
MSRLILVGRDGTQPRRRDGVPQQVYAIRDATGTLVAEHVCDELPNGDQRLWRRSDGKNGLRGLKLRDLPLYGARELAVAKD